MNARIRSKLLALTAIGLFSGCALTNKADAQHPRFFSPERDPIEQESQVASAPGLELRLGHVGSASHLEERISYRLDPAELGYYEDRRWTEAPESYLRRALERELFERRGIRRVLSGSGTTLDVELTAFEELKGKKPSVRVALHVTLHDEERATFERSLVRDQPLPEAGDDPRRVAQALGLALSAAVSEVSDEVARSLRARPATPCVDTETPVSKDDPADHPPR
jgi:cholesterol transport system auxiliary component